MKFLEKDKLENKLTKKVKSIGILGGTFDPAHLGHVKLSSTAREKFKIDEIIWAVTKKNPFKNKSSKNLKQRIYQAKKLVRDKKFIKVFPISCSDRIFACSNVPVMNENMFRSKVTIQRHPH